MGKVKIGPYFYLTADILTKVLQKCSLSSPLQNISFLFKPLNCICLHGNRKAKFAKKYSLVNTSEALWGIKLKLCRNVYNISSTKTIFLIAVAHYFCCYGSLKFLLTYN